MKLQVPHKNSFSYQDGKGKDGQGYTGGGSLWKLALGSVRQVMINIQ